MKKLITTVALNLIIYVVPLAPNLGLIANFKLVAVFLAATVLFMSQPALSAKEAKEKKSTDRNSLYAILLAAMVGQIVSVIEWAYVLGEPHGIRNVSVATIGLVMMAGGILFRLWSIRTLGKFFTATVQIKDDHRVVNVGPYRLVRHPSYLGAFIAIVGSAIFLEAPVGAVVSFIGMAIAYKLRIDAEETALVEALGDSYRRYQQETKRLIPFVW